MTARAEISQTRRHLTSWLDKHANSLTEDAGKYATRVLLGLIAIEKNRTTSPVIINGLAEDVAALERALAPIMRRQCGI